MYKLNNEGFTLVEVLAVVAIIAVLGIIAVPNVLNTIAKSRQATYDILVEDITIAGKQLFEELEFTGSTSKLVHYDNFGNTANFIKINDDKTVTVTLQTLVSNGFLIGSNNPDKNTNGNNNSKIITNPKTKADIGTCNITITKVVDSTNNYNTSYKIENADITLNNNCPKTEEYNKVIK